MSGAVVVQIDSMAPHPNADKLDLLWFSAGPEYAGQCITGKHYRVGQLGIYIPAGFTIPGWMAEDMWLFGRKTAMKQRFGVKTIDLQGLPSSGLFCGQIYRKDVSDERSVDRYEKLAIEGGNLSVVQTEGADSGAWINWPFWRPWWKLSDDVTAYLGITKT